MWIVTEKGDAINLEKSYKLTTSHFWTDKGEFYGVSALTSGIFFGDNNVTVDDTHIKSFRTEDDAKDYISDLVVQMNCEDANGEFIAGILNSKFLNLNCPEGRSFRNELNGKLRADDDDDLDDDDEWDEDTAEDLDDDDEEEIFD